MGNFQSYVRNLGEVSRGAQYTVSFKKTSSCKKITSAEAGCGCTTLGSLNDPEQFLANWSTGETQGEATKNIFVNYEDGNQDILTIKAMVK